MTNLRDSSFILTASDHGTMIVNRHDYQNTETGSYGVGHQILSKQNFDYDEVKIALTLLNSRKQIHGKDIVALDCGANIGVHTIEWAKHMFGWGEVIAFEPQERIYYALCGNITINNCSNARAIWAALGAEDAVIEVPRLNYDRPSSFGSLELRPGENNEFIGQDVAYRSDQNIMTRLIAIDGLDLPAVHFIKIDVEGMELEVLEGSAATIAKSKPILMIEKIKTDQDQLQKMLKQMGYKAHDMGINILATHMDDPITASLKITNG